MRVHYALLDDEAVILFNYFKIPYETLGGKACVPVDEYQGHMDDIESKLEELGYDNELWATWDEVDYDHKYWSTESQTWL